MAFGENFLMSDSWNSSHDQLEVIGFDLKPFFTQILKEIFVKRNFNKILLKYSSPLEFSKKFSHEEQDLQSAAQNYIQL